MGHLLLERLNALAQQFSAPSRPQSQASLGGQHERFGLRASNGIAWVMSHRQPQTPIRRAFQADDASLVSQPDLVIHVPKSGMGIGLAGIGNGNAGQIAIHAHPFPLCAQHLQLSIEVGLADLFQHLDDPLDLLPAQSTQRPAHAAVIRPGGLSPGLRHCLILIQGMSCQADLLQVLQPGQDGHQKFQHLALRPVMIVLLLEGQSLELLDQADVFGKPAPRHQKGVLSLLYVCFAVVHDRSLLRWE